MNYPTFKVKGDPTPLDKLVVCDRCQVAEWTIHSNLQSYHSQCGSRMREATKKEYGNVRIWLLPDFLRDSILKNKGKKINKK